MRKNPPPSNGSSNHTPSPRTQNTTLTTTHTHTQHAPGYSHTTHLATTQILNTARGGPLPSLVRFRPALYYHFCSSHLILPRLILPTHFPSQICLSLSLLPLTLSPLTSHLFCLTTTPSYYETAPPKYSTLYTRRKLSYIKVSCVACAPRSKALLPVACNASTINLHAQTRHPPSISSRPQGTFASR